MTLQFSMRTFVIVLTLLGLGFACVVASNSLAANAIYTLNWILMCLSLVAAVVLRGEQRIFWIGFAVFAWCYWYMGAPAESNPSPRSVVATMSAGSWNVNDSDTSPPLNPARLVSGIFIDFLEARVHRRWSIGDAVVAQYNNGGYYPGVVDDVQNGLYLIRWTDGSSSPAQWTIPAQIQPGTSIVRISANSLVCSLWGLIGGFLGSALFRVREVKARAEKTLGRSAAEAPSASNETGKARGSGESIANVDSGDLVRVFDNDRV
jgi:hypothetical protein